MKLVFFSLLLLFLSCEPSPKDMDTHFQVQVEPKILDYFQEDYLSARDRFQRAISGTRDWIKQNPSLGLRLESESVEVPSQDKLIDYRVDYAVLSSGKKNPKTLVILSGTHGAEALTGSGLQVHFLEEIYPSLSKPEDYQVILIHILNPWGAHHGRRTTEANVDLNRNFGLSSEVFQTKNEGYSSIYSLLNPKDVASKSDWSNHFFFPKAVFNILIHGMPALKQAALQGQYEYPEGVYFGGKDFEPQKNLLESILKKFIQDPEKLLFVDLHTGYGERGKLHFFPSDPKSEKSKELTEQVFKGFPIDWASNDDFYTVTGEISVFVCELFPQIEQCIPMVFEYGTLDSQTTTGAIESIHRIILENQGYWKGFANEKEKETIQATYREMFYPISPAWRTKVTLDTEKTWKAIFSQF